VVQNLVWELELVLLCIGLISRENVRKKERERKRKREINKPIDE